MAEERVERRLTAILAGDVAGYSRLMGADEEGTLKRLNAHRREFLEPKIAECRGRVVKRTGDGILIEFASAVDAGRCAVEIQRGMTERNSLTPLDKRIELRIGIHVGDIIIEEGDIFGDGVNIAARLEGIAEPGGICISDDAYRQVRDKLNIAIADAGEQQLKNIARPVRVYRVKLGDGDAAPPTAPAAALSDKPSIAVLPFVNMSGDPEQEYFADGMVDEIITGLSRIKWLSVISRNSSFIYKNKPVVMKDIAENFHVRYVLEGGVRKSGNRIRVIVQLIDTAKDTHLWAEQYDRVQEDIFALQDEIAMHVIGAIEPSLRKAELDRIKRQRPSSLNAYDLVLRSLPFALSHVPQDSQVAIPPLQQALKLQPDYAAAHAFLGRCLHHRYARGGLREADRLAAIQHAHAAIAHGSDDATALAAAAHVIAFDEHDTGMALKLFDRALELSNSNVFALNFSAIILAWMGKTELAVERAQLAIRLSPFDFYNSRAHHALAIVHFYCQRYADALDAARRAVHANPGHSTAHAVLAAALSRVGRGAEAKEAARGVLEHEPTFTIQGVWRVAGGLEPAVFNPLADAWREIGLPE